MNKDKTPANYEHKKNILLVDDNEIDNYIHEKSFMHFGKFSCKTFCSSYAALEHLRETKIKYDYIVLDIYMPDMNGFSFVEHFNRLLLNKIHGLLIILTASLNPIDREKALNDGLVFLEKPLRMEKFFELR